MQTDPAELQRHYYARTAGEYDSMHVHPGDEHYVALRHISSLVDELSLRSILDVGSGTGRGVRHFLERHPSMTVVGLEPVAELVDQAVDVHGVKAGIIRQGVGEALPFDDESFDAVCEIGMLHHVPDPDAVVREMVRVARRAVFLSDENTFGWGTLRSRLLKLALHRTRLFRLAEWANTRGRGFRVTPDDGVSYAYSVYQNLAPLKAWADRVFLVPTVPATKGTWLHPLLTTSHLLVVAIRD